MESLSPSLTSSSSPIIPTPLAKEENVIAEILDGFDGLDELQEEAPHSTTSHVPSKSSSSESSRHKSEDRAKREDTHREHRRTSSGKTSSSSSPPSKEREVTKKKKRYFVIKSFTPKHLEISIEKSIWATQPHNEVKLNRALQNSDVILIFSVNNSRHFQGYARMTSGIGRTSNVWTEDTKSWGGAFHVEWITLYDLPFSETLHIRNPFNSDKPVKISRDGQELSPEAGKQLCTMLDDGAALLGRKRSAPSEGDQVAKKQKTEEVKEETANETKEAPKSSPSRSSKSHRSPSPPRYSSRSSRYHSDHSPRQRNRSPSPHRKHRGSLDLLNMTYEDYLTEMREKYRGNWIPLGAPPLPGGSDSRYFDHNMWSKSRYSSAIPSDHYSSRRSRR